MTPISNQKWCITVVDNLLQEIPQKHSEEQFSTSIRTTPFHLKRVVYMFHSAAGDLVPIVHAVVRLYKTCSVTLHVSIVFSKTALVCFLSETKLVMLTSYDEPTEHMLEGVGT